MDLENVCMYGEENRERMLQGETGVLKTTDRNELSKDAFMFHDNHI